MKLKKDFVATALIFDENKKMLLVDHKRLGLWLPPGGHIEEEENPEEALLREIKEETGFEIEILGERFRETEINGISKALFLPFHLQVESIPKDSHRDFLHEHIDLIYLCRIVGGKLAHEKSAHHAIRWFSLEEMKKEPRVSKDTLLLAEKALK
ncbi:MAG: NUDIX domain-containing protein [Candidatus ainarchaeum sp.]|nr:NUDIX domain-containing protein [Candidatus ainarchaeum sp.]